MKLSTHKFGDRLKALGFDFYSGVPCSFLKYLINYAINECDYVMAANEGDAVAVASGANLGGRKSVVLMQNSGLTNAVSPLTSLNFTFQIPVLGFVSLRGERGLGDEPQHELMGEITGGLLSTMKIKWDYLSLDQEEAHQQLDLANRFIENNSSYFFVVKKNTFDKVVLNNEPASTLSRPQNNLNTSVDMDKLPERIEALEALNQVTSLETLLLATTGKTGRELFEVEDRPSNLYMVGSMGCISSLGLGLAMSRPERKVIVIDGDGSLIMRMGAMPTLAYYQPNNLLHILLDNNAHDSTGGQATVSDRIDFPALAHSVGYGKVIQVQSIHDFKIEVKKWEEKPSLAFIYLKVEKGSKKNLGRPSIKPHQVKQRMKEYING